MKLSLILVLFFFGFFSSLVSSQSDSCNSALGTVSHLIPFDTSSLSCFSAWGSENFILRYTKSSPSLHSYVLSAPDTNAYIAVGFSSDGNMVGCSAVAGWITNSGPGMVKQYYLGGKGSSQCPPDQGSLKLVQNKSVIVSRSSRLYIAFQLSVAQPAPYNIYAVGPKNSLPSSSNYYLPEHRSMVSGPAGSDAGGGSPAVISAARWHGILVLLGWGVLIPVGAMAARYFKQWDPFWFYFHVSVQGIGYVLGLAGVIIGFGLDDEGISNVGLHKALGFFILVFGSLQVTAVLIRPAKSSKVRRYWNWCHWYVGRLAIALAIGNLFFGFSIADENSSWSIGYGVFLGIWVIASIFLEVRKCMNDE